MEDIVGINKNFKKIAPGFTLRVLAVVMISSLDLKMVL
jgi:hypothetical protein